MNPDGTLTATNATDPQSLLGTVLNSNVATVLANNLSTNPAVITASNQPATAAASAASMRSVLLVGAATLVALALVFHKG
jgi:membrane-bound lytic murein transglycosylase